MKKDWASLCVFMGGLAVLAPLALVLFFAVIAFLFLAPLFCLIYLFVEPVWGIAGGLAWGTSLFLLRKPLRLYFKTDAKPWM